MREGERRRLFFACLFALAAGMFVAWAHPVERIKADLRADAQGLVMSFEYAVQKARG